MKVLLGWELGGGQGHIQRLAQLARMLELQGFEPVFALKSYKFEGIKFPWQIVFAPRLTLLGGGDSYTFTDILENFGFGNADLLQFYLHSWRYVLEEVKPNLIIADHAPALVLAAHGIVPTIVLGSCFTVPPAVEEFPPVRFPVPPESTQHQQQVSSVVRKLVKFDEPLGQVFNGAASFIFGIPELDSYRHLRVKEKYVGLHISPIPVNIYSGDGSVWGYLSKSYPYYDLVMRSIKPQCEFKSLKEVLVGKSLAIHHGGLTTSIACLLAGIPQLVLPNYLEQQLNGIALSSLGVAKFVTKPTWENLLLAETEARELAANAKLQAENLAYWNQNFTEDVIKTCLQLTAKSEL